MNIEATDSDSVFIDDSVEPAVINDVIGVTVDVVVHLTGRHRKDVFVVGAGQLRIVGAAKAAKVLGSPRSLQSTFIRVLKRQLG